MNKRIFSEDEQNKLSTNHNVLKCSSRSVTYTTKFKIRAVKKYELGLTATEIFRNAEFNLDLIGKEIPNDCLRRWRRIVKRKGFSGLSEARGKKKGSRPKKNKMSTTERLKYLEAEVKYLKAENSFLVELRARRAE